MAAITKRNTETIGKKLDTDAGSLPVEPAKHNSEEKRLSLKELNSLLKLCADPRPHVREAALLRLLHPPVSRELIHYRRLLRYLPKRLSTVGQLPPSLIEFFCDAVGFLEPSSDTAPSEASLIRLLKHLPHRSVRMLLDRALPLRPFLIHLPVRSFAWAQGGAPLQFRRRWRLLRKRLVDDSSSPSWSRLTTSQLSPLRQRRHPDGCRRFSKGRWMAVGRVLQSSPGDFSSPPFFPSSFASVYWGGKGKRSLRYLDRLMHHQAEELRSIRGLAHQVSRKTRRVVLSWHNASLAAAGGWAFETLDRQFPSTALRQELVEAVEMQVQKMNGKGDRREHFPEHLRKWREERLILPKMLHLLWESRIRMTLDSAWKDQWRKDLKLIRPYLEPGKLSEELRFEKYSWYGGVSPHQRIVPEHLFGEAENRRALWRHGLVRLAALIREGQRLLDRGSLSSLVLPWIDKFFISSRREEDVYYLPSVVEWLESRGCEPLILFWEDTIHARTPSFLLALKRLHEEGHPYRGIGMYDWNGTQRNDAEQIILNEHSHTRLFALRPYDDRHSTRSFSQLLETLDPGFFRAYDSSWKDNLAFLYAGTQVSSLLAVQCEEEIFPSWIASEHKRYPFGAYLRRWLRREVLGETDTGTPADAFSHCYALWAHLC